MDYVSPPMMSPLPSHALARHGDLAWRTRGLIVDLSVSPSGRRVAAASQESLYVWDTADGAVVASPVVGAVPAMEVRRATMLDDDTVLISSGFKTVDVWSLREGRALRSVSITAGGCYDYPVSAVGLRAAIPQSDGAWALWDLATAERIADVQGVAPWGIERAALSLDGARLATSHRTELALWDVATGRKIAARPNEPGVTPMVQFSPDGRRVVASTVHKLVIWDVDTDTRTDLPIQGLYPKARFSPDGAMLALLRSDIELTMWSLAESRRVAVRAMGDCGWMGGIDYLPDGTLMFGVDRGVQRLDGVTGARVGGYDPVDDAVRAVAFVHDGTQVQSDRAGRRAVWAVGDGATVSEVDRAVRTEPTSLRAVTDDGAYTLSSEGFKHQRGQGPLSLSARGEPSPRWTVPMKTGYRALALARDGSTVAFVHGRRVTMLDGATGDALEGVVLKVGLTAVALSPDGARLAVGDERGVVRVYVRPGRKPRLELVGHIGPVSALAFRDDGALLASGALDGTSVVWDVASALAPSKRARKKA